jgi:hypothetical protein
MGQLESYGINEMYLSGMAIGLFSNYVAEEDESDTFESAKVYIYSMNFLTKKRKHHKFSPLLVVSGDDAIYATKNFFNTNEGGSFEMTKIVDDFLIWQDASLIDFKIDEHVIKLQQKYN